jgi:hypothetical protein
MLVDNETRIMINNNYMLIPRDGYFILYSYQYNPYTEEFIYIEVDEVQTISEGFKYDRKFHHSQFTKKDFEKGLKD